jgi:hypothetical protein
MQEWICPYYLTSARCPCTALTKYVPRVVSRRTLPASDGDSCEEDEDEEAVDNMMSGEQSLSSWLRQDPLSNRSFSASFHLVLLRADETERHTAFHTVDRLTALLSLLAEDIEREIVRGAPGREVGRRERQGLCGREEEEERLRGGALWDKEGRTGLAREVAGGVGQVPEPTLVCFYHQLF